MSADPTSDAQAAFDAFSRQVFADGTLSTWMKQVVAVAVAHATQCPSCMRGHLEIALGAGATPNELMEAVWVAAAMHADGPTMHSTPLLASLGKQVRLRPGAPPLLPRL